MNDLAVIEIEISRWKLTVRRGKIGEKELRLTLDDRLENDFAEVASDFAKAQKRSKRASNERTRERTHDWPSSLAWHSIRPLEISPAGNYPVGGGVAPFESMHN